MYIRAQTILVIGLLAGISAVNCLDLPVAAHGSDEWVKAFARAAMKGDRFMEEFLHMVENMQTRAVGNIQEHAQKNPTAIMVGAIGIYLSPQGISVAPTGVNINPFATSIGASSHRP